MGASSETVSRDPRLQAHFDEAAERSEPCSPPCQEGEDAVDDGGAGLTHQASAPALSNQSAQMCSPNERSCQGEEALDWEVTDLGLSSAPRNVPCQIDLTRDSLDEIHRALALLPNDRPAKEVVSLQALGPAHDARSANYFAQGGLLCKAGQAGGSAVALETLKPPCSAQPAERSEPGGLAFMEAENCNMTRPVEASGIIDHSAERRQKGAMPGQDMQTGGNGQPYQVMAPAHN